MGATATASAFAVLSATWSCRSGSLTGRLEGGTKRRSHQNRIRRRFGCQGGAGGSRLSGLPLPAVPGSAIAGAPFGSTDTVASASDATASARSGASSATNSLGGDAVSSATSSTATSSSNGSTSATSASSKASAADSNHSYSTAVSSIFSSVRLKSEPVKVASPST